MGWKLNRRRKRTWYGHYKRLAEEIRRTVAAARNRPLNAADILRMFYELYERRRLHGKRRIAASAFESMLLAAFDTELDTYLLTTQRTTGRSIDISRFDPPTQQRRDRGVDVAAGPDRTARTMVFDPARLSFEERNRLVRLLQQEAVRRGEIYVFSQVGQRPGPMPPRVDVPVRPAETRPLDSILEDLGEMPAPPQPQPPSRDVPF